MPRRSRPATSAEPLELRRLLASDKNVDQLDAGHGVGCGCCVCTPSPQGVITALQRPANIDTPTGHNGAGDLTLAASESVPAFSSFPTATAKLFLDFDGDVTASWSSYSPGTTPAYDTNGNPGVFDANEQSAIQQIWARVAEKYAPFRIDVTTVDPGTGTNKAKVVIGGDGLWYNSGSAAGVAILNGWTNTPRTAWVFSAQNPFNYKFLAESTAHEAGHMFGLAHQSRYDANGVKIEEYNSGGPNKAPIMGFSSNATRGMWWNGPNSAGSTVIQDDLATISRFSNGFGYRTDDVGQTDAASLPLLQDAPGSASYSRTGVLHRTTDVDTFRFAIGAASSVFVTLSIADIFGIQIGMLDGSIAVRNAAGSVIGQSATNFLGEQLVFGSLQPGVYFVDVSSAGNYGDIGQYTLRNTLPLDNTAPTINSSGFTFETAHAIDVQFSEYVDTTLAAGDLTVENLSAGGTTAASSYTYNNQTQAANFAFAAPLADGNYRGRIAAGAIGDFAGNPLAADYTFDFFVFAGDANRDRTINIGDFAVVAGNFNNAGTYSLGDFNYDGTVGIGDFSILASKFNTSLPAARAPSGAPAPAAIAGKAVTFGQTPIEKETLAGDVL